MIKNILVLEDELGIRSFVALNLKKEGFNVFEADNGKDAIKILEEKKIHIALLDVMLPDISGIEVCKYIRENNEDMGIIMLTAKAQENDKIEGLTSGSDDYIVKPFSPKELIARINALLRRSFKESSKNEDQLIHGPFVLDLNKRTLTRDNRNIELTPTEFSIIRLLILENKRSVSRDKILNEVWGKNYIGDLKVVDVNVRRIRSKIEDDPSNPIYLKTVWGLGYCFGKED